MFGFRQRFRSRRRESKRQEREVRALSRQDAGHELLPAILANLALRDLTLVESLLRLVEEQEERAGDPEQLESLFRIDHLSTRMRRNAENLLVLAGQESNQARQEPMPLLDVVRAAVSEVVQYERVQITRLPRAEVAGPAANDVSHLLAELLENATSTSPQHTPVTVYARPYNDGSVVLAIEDGGIGIPPERLQALNTRLRGPPSLDVTATRHTGLYVVSRLAHRHGIRVQLRSRPRGGTVAYVAIPYPLLRPAETAVAPRSRQGGEPFARPAGSGATPGGLPKRVPSSRPRAPAGHGGLPGGGGPQVPERAGSRDSPGNVGSTGSTGTTGDTAGTGAVLAAAEPERVRNELSGFQRGRRAARSGVDEGGTPSSAPDGSDGGPDPEGSTEDGDSGGIG